MGARLRTGRCLGVARDLGVLWGAARFLAPRLEADDRRDLSTRLAQRTLATLGVRVTWSGETLPPAEPVLVVANHTSWLDVYVLNAIRSMRFVAKAETRGWPIVGTIASRFDSIFIVRGSCRDAARVKARVGAARRAGESVGVFPEATTTDGNQVKPFHAAMFQAAVDAGTRVLPVALRYPGPDGRPNAAAAFIDDMTFGASLLNVMREPFLHAEARFGAPLETAGRTRRELAVASRAFIVDALASPASAVEAPPERLRKEPPWRGLGMPRPLRGRPSLATT